MTCPLNHCLICWKYITLGYTIPWKVKNILALVQLWDFKTNWKYVFSFRSKSQHQFERQPGEGVSHNKGKEYSTLPRRLRENRTTRSHQTVSRSSSVSRAYSSRQSSMPISKVNSRVPPPPDQPTLSSLMRSSRSVSSGLSKMAISGGSARPRLLSNASNSTANNSRKHLPFYELNKMENEQNKDFEVSCEEDQINAKAEGARPKTPSGAKRPNKLKQGKTLSTSMEIWQIQKELKRGEMVQVRTV